MVGERKSRERKIKRERKEDTDEARLRAEDEVENKVLYVEGQKKEGRCGRERKDGKRKRR